MTILSDVQRRLAAVERPTSPCPSPAPQEEMEIIDLPSEAADDFSSEEENEEWGTPTLTEATVSEPPFHDHPAAEGGSHRYGDFGVILGGLSPRGRARVEDVPGYCELSIPEGERLQPHIPWTTPDATLVSRRDIPQRSKFGPHN